MSEQQKNSIINIPSLIDAYKKHWKWVALSVFVFLLLGVVVYKKQIQHCEVIAQVLISDETSSQSSSLGDIASMFGGGSSFGSNRSIEDEMVIVKAHSLLKKTAIELGANEQYFVHEKFLKNEPVYYNQPLQLVYDHSIADTLGVGLRFEIKYDKSGDTDIKVRGLKNKVIFKAKNVNLPYYIDTPYGGFTLVKDSTYIPPRGDMEETIIITSYDAAATVLSKLITVDLSAKKTDIMSLNFVTTNALYGKTLINTLIDNYNELTIQQKRAFHIKTLQFLEDRIRTISAEVDSTQSQVEDFMGRKDMVNPGAQASIYLTQTTSQEVELIRAESNYELLGMAIEFLSNEANNTSMLPIMPSIASLTPLINGYNDLILQRLSIETSAKGDNMALKAINKRIEVVRDNLLAALDKQSETSSFEINELRRQFAKSKNKLETMPGIELEYSNILRQQTLKEQLYVFLLQQREETEMAIAGAHPRGVIVDEAFVTDSILGMSPKIIFGVFFLLGLFFPAIIILALWIIRRKISIIDQAVELSGGMPVIARIPLMSGEEPVVANNPESLESKRVRILRSNLLSILDNQEDKHGGQVIAITSTSDDAQTSQLVALNLASSIAMTGRKTVLVNADVFEPCKVGLLGACGKSTLQSCMVTGDIVVATVRLGSTDSELYFIGCEVDQMYGADTLASISYDRFIDDIASNYDVVVIAAPSVGRYFASIEQICLKTDVLLSTVTLNHTTKTDISKLSTIKSTSRGAFLIQID
ncbi:MAG: hypothetical protein NC082_03795 [Clostridiales bacterium]|nr:hypothetical protein [Clostridiales bacterium]